MYDLVPTIAKRLQRYKKKSNNHTIPYYNCRNRLLNYGFNLNNNRFRPVWLRHFIKHEIDIKHYGNAKNPKQIAANASVSDYLFVFFLIFP